MRPACLGADSLKAYDTLVQLKQDLLEFVHPELKHFTGLAERYQLLMDRKL